MSEANKTQVGGAHYSATAAQHWDLAIDLHLGYLEGQITKYVDRHKRKNKRQDVEKARHFAAKLLEAYDQDRVMVPMALGRPKFTMTRLRAFQTGRPDLTNLEHQIIALASIWRCREDLIELGQLITELLDVTYPEPVTPQVG